MKKINRILGWLGLDYCTSCGFKMYPYGYNFRIRCENSWCKKYYKNEVTQIWE